MKKKRWRREREKKKKQSVPDYRAYSLDPRVKGRRLRRGGEEREKERKQEGKNKAKGKGYGAEMVIWSSKEREKSGGRNKFISLV